MQTLYISDTLKHGAWPQPEMLNTAFRYFLAVVDSGSLTGAALVLNVAPSAVSRMIRRLEEEYDVPLFERHGRGMVLTEAGQLLAESARRGLIEAEQARMDITNLRKTGKRLIRISANQAFGMDLLPNLMAKYQNIEPEVSFDLTLLRASEIHKRVKDGEDDIGIAYGLRPAVDVNLQFSRRIRILALVAMNHPLAQRGAVTVADLAPYPIGQMTIGTTIRTMVDLCCMHENVSLATTFVSNNVTALQNFCLHRANAVIFSGEFNAASIVKQCSLVALPLIDAQLHQRHMQIISMKGRSLPNSAKRFLDLLIAHIRESTDLRAGGRVVPPTENHHAVHIKEPTPQTSAEHG